MPRMRTPNYLLFGRGSSGLQHEGVSMGTLTPRTGPRRALSVGSPKVFNTHRLGRRRLAAQPAGGAGGDVPVPGVAGKKRANRLTLTVEFVSFVVRPAAGGKTAQGAVGALRRPPITMVPGGVFSAPRRFRQQERAKGVI